MTRDLQDRVAIVTGAGRGVGRAHAHELAALGARVVVNDLGTAGDGSGGAHGPAEQVCAEIRAAGGEAVPDFGDVADEAASAALIARAVDTFGRLDVLVCNAGIIRGGPLQDISVEQWDLMSAVNLRGHFLPVREAARYWSGRAAESGQRVYGSIVLTASRAGLVGSQGQLDYAATKAGIAAMAVVIARELAPIGVRANAVCPRGRTRMTAGAPGYEAPIGDGFDVKAVENNSAMVGYLASPLSADVSGQVFVVGEDNVQWMRGWTQQGELRKPHARLTVAEIDSGARVLFSDRPTQPSEGLALPTTGGSPEAP
ncbi:SDR family NAD(P)-dependent oxidoreductase [Tsukamurella ocularis]|uniref:SDR family NAD(P)-dependent oxidoreductase n=1 Tax=Tsukamurella ocularis TaxID=1970234 RepID=UPI0039F108D1